MLESGKTDCRSDVGLIIADSHNEVTWQFTVYIEILKPLSKPGLGWLKDYYFHLLHYMVIAQRLVTTMKGKELTELSFWVWGSGFITLHWVDF
jgi:hypothetical protein